MPPHLRTYRITDASGRTSTVQRSDAFIEKLCLGIAGGGFNPTQTRRAQALRQALLCEGRAIERNGCTIRLVDHHEDPTTGEVIEVCLH